MSSPITPLDPEQTAQQEAQAAHEAYLHRLIVALDIFLNVASDGKEDMTISTRAALAAKHGSPIGIALSKFLNVFQHDHGAKAASGDEERAKSLEETIGQSDVIDVQAKPTGPVA